MSLNTQINKLFFYKTNKKFKKIKKLFTPAKLEKVTARLNRQSFRVCSGIPEQALIFAAL